MIPREVFEETGLRVVARESLEVVLVETPQITYEIAEVLCVPSDPSNLAVAPSEEASDVAWVPWTQIGAYGLTPALIAVLERARAKVALTETRSTDRGPR